MILPEIEEKLRQPRHDFDVATSESIIGLGDRYLELLNESHREVSDHPAAHPGSIEPADYSSASYEALHNTQRAIQDTLAMIAQERNRVEAILDPFTEMTVGEAIEMLNSHKYKGHGSWKFGEGGITDGSGNTVSMQEAVDIASLLRREEYVAKKASSD